MSTHLLFCRLNRGLERCYQLKERRLGTLFVDWCSCLGLKRDDDIAFELTKGPQKCRLVLFDPNSPIVSSKYKPMTRSWRNRIHEVLLRCSDEPDAFSMDIALTSSPNPINDILVFVVHDQRALLQGYIRQFHVHVPTDVVKVCRGFFQLDLATVPGVARRAVRRAVQNRSELAGQVKVIAKSLMSEGWFAVKLLSIMLSAPTLYDHSMQGRLYQQRAFTLIEWGEYDAAERDVFDWLALETTVKRAVSGQYNLCHMAEVLTMHRRYEQAQRYLRIAIPLSRDDTIAQVMCHKHMCLIYEHRRTELKHLRRWGKKQRAVYQEAEEHYIALMRLEPDTDRHLYDYAEYLMRAKKNITSEDIATALMDVHSHTELSYRCAFALGKLLADKGHAATALEYLIDAQRRGPMPKKANRRSQFQSECMFAIAQTFEKLRELEYDFVEWQHMMWHQNAIIEAKKWYERAIQYSPTLTAAYYHSLGRMLVQHTRLYELASQNLLVAITLMEEQNRDAEHDAAYHNAKHYYKQALKRQQSWLGNL